MMMVVVGGDSGGVGVMEVDSGSDAGVGGGKLVVGGNGGVGVVEVESGSDDGVGGGKLVVGGSGGVGVVKVDSCRGWWWWLSYSSQCLQTPKSEDVLSQN